MRMDVDHFKKGFILRIEIYKEPSSESERTWINPGLNGFFREADNEEFLETFRRFWQRKRNFQSFWSICPGHNTTTQVQKK